MGDVQAEIRPIGEPGDLGWVVMAHGEQYVAEFGWDGSFEALVARIVADFTADKDPAHDPARDAAWIAELDGRRVGCVFCVAGEETDTAKLRILLVDPVARGQRLGARLVASVDLVMREKNAGALIVDPSFIFTRDHLTKLLSWARAGRTLVIPRSALYSRRYHRCSGPRRQSPRW